MNTIDQIVEALTRRADTSTVQQAQQRAAAERADARRWWATQRERLDQRQRDLAGDTAVHDNHGGCR
jgi:hypothetical protein